MMIRLSRALRSRVQGGAPDSGIAMIMVMGTIMVLTALLVAAMGYAMSVQPQARKDQDWNAALAAAQAGVDDYIARLNGSDIYWDKKDECLTQNPALKGPAYPGNTCGYTASTAPGWQNVQVANPAAGQFHYDVDSSILSSQGQVRLSSTGKVGKSSRTIQVNVSRGGPTSFLYYTDFEDADPGNTTAYGTTGADTNSCGKGGYAAADYFWANSNRGSGESGSNGGPSGDCSEITFIGADTLDGAVHFNDTPLMSGSPNFKKGYETSAPNCANTPYNVNNCKRGTATPNLNGNQAKWAATLDLEDNSSKFATFPGCVYTGDTRIIFKSNGTMDVWNTKSAVGSPPAVPGVVGPGSPTGTNCGNVANFKPTSAADLTPSSSYSKQNVPVPNDLVIYVKNAPATTSCVPGQIVNGSTSGSVSADVIPQGSSGVVTDISYFDPDNIVTSQNRVFTRPNNNNGTNWNTPLAPLNPSAGSPDANGDDHPQTFDCGSGNVYIEGTVKGRVTIAASNNVVVTGDLLVDGVSPPAAAAGSSMVGLVAGNSVVVYHPVSRDTNSPTNSVAKIAGDGSSNNNCDSTVGVAPSKSSSSGKTMTCEWSSTKTYKTGSGDYNDLSFPGQTSSSGDRYIYGSIQTLQHSFWVQNYNRGNGLGTLNVRGSIAQRWRGIVGTSGGSTGFAKDYSYDTRLKFSGPPYFPQWTNSVWGAQTTGEIKPAY